MYAMSPVFLRRTVALVALLVFATAATAQSLPVNATDLGQAQPRTADLSINPNFHVYVFQLNSIRYIQINDLQNTVRATFAVANGQVLPLPSGLDSLSVSAQRQPAQNTAASLGGTVYQDSQVQVIVVPQSGGYAWNVLTPAPTTVNALAPSQNTQLMVCTKRECSGVSAQPTIDQAQ